MSDELASKRRAWHYLFFSGLLLTGFALFAVLGLAAYARQFDNRVLPGVFLGRYEIGGMTRTQLRDWLQAKSDALSQDGIHVTFFNPSGKDAFVLYPMIVTDDSTQDLVHIDIDAAMNFLLAYGRGQNMAGRLLAPLRTKQVEPVLSIPIFVNTTTLTATLANHLRVYEQSPRNAGIKISSLEPLAYEITPAASGYLYDYGATIERISESWGTLEAPKVLLKRSAVQPQITELDLQGIEPQMHRLFAGDNFILTYVDASSSQALSWPITRANIAQWLEPALQAGKIALGLGSEPVRHFIETVVAPEINLEARDAKFRVDKDGRVVEFQASRSGRLVDSEQTSAALNAKIAERIFRGEVSDIAVPIVVRPVTPAVTTAQVNDLGIIQVLGTGVSNFFGSPVNRIKNIRNAVKKLNGILIKPGEIFSTLVHTAPFTEAGGYVPELVIKGDELKPEIGGGLCQIGTTMFRMSMNSALPIVERHNHSLVVQYYADSRNRNPGTDATIYDPAPDFRFQNDTGHHLLLQTDMDTKRGELRFTLWGTSDGRTASYTAPRVVRWIPHEDTKTIETDKLAVGERKCQHAFRGAEAWFTYSRELPNGVKEDKVFESHYRPLPEICLVGVAQKSASTTMVNSLPPAIE